LSGVHSGQFCSVLQNFQLCVRNRIAPWSNNDSTDLLKRSKLLVYANCAT
jgi:hypothetical protein